MSTRSWRTTGSALVASAFLAACASPYEVVMRPEHPRIVPAPVKHTEETKLTGKPNTPPRRATPPTPQD